MPAQARLLLYSRVSTSASSHLMLALRAGLLAANVSEDTSSRRSACTTELSIRSAAAEGWHLRFTCSMALPGGNTPGDAPACSTLSAVSRHGPCSVPKLAACRICSGVGRDLCAPCLCMHACIYANTARIAEHDLMIWLCTALTSPAVAGQANVDSADVRRFSPLAMCTLRACLSCSLSTSAQQPVAAHQAANSAQPATSGGCRPSCMAATEQQLLLRT